MRKEIKIIVNTKEEDERLLRYTQKWCRENFKQQSEIELNGKKVLSFNFSPEKPKEEIKNTKQKEL